MTNTPMTSREAFESWWGASKYTQVIYHKDSNYQIAKDAWQASQAHQAQTIAELVEALEFMMLHTSVYGDNPKMINARTLIAKLRG